MTYYQRCVHLLSDVEDAESVFRNAVPKGLLRVNLQSTLVRHFVVSALPEFLLRYPGIELHIGEGDRLVDLERPLLNPESGCSTWSLNRKRARKRNIRTGRQAVSRFDVITSPPGLSRTTAAAATAAIPSWCDRDP
jgi:hypothetical protein